MNILEELFNGQICPKKKMGYRDEEYRELEKLYEWNEKKLLSTMNQEQQEKLENMKGQWEEMEYITACASFIEGFHLAVQLMVLSE